MTTPRALTPLPLGSVELTYGMAWSRRELVRELVRSYTPDNLLQNHLLEAGLIQINEQPQGIHWGWESPTSMVRGHYVGHWMSAMATFWATTGDTWAKGLLDHVVSRLAECQQANGGEWLLGIPEKYLHWIKKGQPVWAPMYIVHKNLMGLFDAHTLAGNEQALPMIEAMARWMLRFTDDMTTEELDDLLDWETGGMQELWADLYGLTGEKDHLELVHRFDRRRLIDRLVAGEDALTNMHANQTVPEIMAAARAYEVTGETRWRDAVLAYWKCAVTDRGTFATGGQTFGEFWPPPFEYAARLGKSNQEHCVVYNMCRLAEKLLQWTGEAQYADYLERNRYNGTYAQQHPQTGMVAYYLPLHAGGRKEWSTRTETFSCCLATMTQGGARHGLTTFYTDGTGLTLAEYLPTVGSWEVGGVAVQVTVGTHEVPPPPSKADFEHGMPPHRPEHFTVDIEVRADSPVEFPLSLRLPWWLTAAPRLTIDGSSVEIPFAPGTFQPITQVWSGQRLRLELPRGLTAVPIPDDPTQVAFMDGPVVLAGLVGERRELRGDPTDPHSVLEPAAEMELAVWQQRWYTKGQLADFPLVALHEVTDEAYTVYFPVR
ncbi:MAG: glycoside hydrolase family 127 protein [Actinomycetota bacterium]|nr:glycoside hydrolase family 127 protein [Actinomycetota bacterium]